MEISKTNECNENYEINLVHFNKQNKKSFKTTLIRP